MKYKVGDKVKIRIDLDRNKIYGLRLNTEMYELRGLEGTVECITSSGNYEVHIPKFGFNFRWPEDMLEPVNKYPIEY